MTGYDKNLAEKYSKNRAKYQSTDNELFNLLDKVDIKNKNILDFGCGNGVYSFELAKRNAAKVIGIDLSEEMIKIGQNRLKETNQPNLEFLQADGNKLPLADQSFDLVFAYFVLVHFKDLNQPLSEIARVLKKNGILIATVNNADFKDDKIKNEVIPIKLGGEYKVIVKDYLRTDDEVKENLEKNNFSIMTFEKISNEDAEVDPTYEFSNQIENFHCILLSALKT